MKVCVYGAATNFYYSRRIWKNNRRARIQKYQNSFMCIMDFGRKGKECKPYTITPAFESMLFLERENDIADYGK